MLPACGYESVPFDLAVGLLDTWAESRSATLERVSVEVTFELRGHARFGSGTSGGTFATLLQHTDPLALTDHPDPTGAQVPLRPRQSGSGDWLAPLMPDPFLNIAVIQRSRHLNGAGPLHYEEGLNTTATTGSSVAGRLAAHAIAWPLERIAALSTGRRRPGDRAVRFALDKLAPKPGRGPSDRELDQFDYEIQVVGAAKGATSRIVITAHGNPGYRSSPALAVEGALSLLDHGGVGGVLTPSTADLDDSASLLERCGMSLAWDRTNPTERDAPATSDKQGPTDASVGASLVELEVFWFRT